MRLDSEQKLSACGRPESRAKFHEQDLNVRNYRKRKTVNRWLPAE